MIRCVGRRVTMTTMTMMRPRGKYDHNDLGVVFARHMTSNTSTVELGLEEEVHVGLIRNE